MKTFLLVIVLSSPNVERLEQHVAIIMPDEATCETVSNAYVHAAMVTEDDERQLLIVEQVTCEEHVDEERV